VRYNLKEIKMQSNSNKMLKQQNNSSLQPTIAVYVIVNYIEKLTERREVGIKIVVF